MRIISARKSFVSRGNRAFSAKGVCHGNIFAKTPIFPRWTISAIWKNGADAAIVSDPGVVYAAKQAAPGLALHLSTQANTTNKYAVKFWQEQGISRVILARELSLREIAEIRDFAPEVELEAFVHGAMCISYSGRCLLSDYLDGRSSNRGACVQACRWKYELARSIPPARKGDFCRSKRTGAEPISSTAKISICFPVWPSWKRRALALLRSRAE
ncbi:MAG: peptidase U32 family protein [Christensenellaceae bacterium]